jgi:MFS family permease
MRRLLLDAPGTRKLLFAACYFSEGAPIGFIWWALPTKLHAAGIPVETTASISALLVLPWVFKFLWAPIIDIGCSGRWGYRPWILTLQFFMGVTLLPLLMLDFQAHLNLLVGFLFVHAIFAATQDAAIDGFAISVVPQHERGSLNGWMQFGMLLGRSLMGGGVLLIESHGGVNITVPLLIATTWMSSTLLIVTLDPHTFQPAPEPFRQRAIGFVERMRGILTSKNTWLVLLFAGMSGAAFESVGAVAGPFLLDQGFSKADVGVFFSVPSVLGMMFGALVGGFLADRMQRRTAVAMTLVIIVLTVLGLAAVTGAGTDTQQTLLLLLLGLLYVSIGMFTATSYALFMDTTDPSLGATQFSAFMGATNGCEAWSAYAVGKLQGTSGYSVAFLFMSAVSLFSLPILRFIRATPVEPRE